MDTEKNLEKAKGMVKNIFSLSREEMHKVAKERVDEISKEFTAGFKFLEDYPKSVTFFGSNQFTEDNEYYKKAKDLSSRITKELGYSILSGGGPGIMEAANRGAFESGGNSLGLVIKLPHEQRINKYITKEMDSYYFFVRKVCLSYSAEAFIFFPGGFGTMDEFFEILTLVQTGKMEGVPLICVGSDYWNNLKSFMQNDMLTRGTITESDMSLFKITDDEDEIIELIRNVPVRIGMPFDGATEVAEIKITNESGK